MIGDVIHVLDLLIVLVLTAGVILGFATGAVKQIVGFIGVVFAFALAYFLMHPAGEVIVHILNVGHSVAPLLGFVAVFALVQLVVIIGIRVTEAILGVLRLTTVNRVVGSLVGVSKALILMSVVFLALKMVDVPDRNAQVQSVLYEPVVTVVPTAWSYLSSEGLNADEFIGQFKDHLEQQFAVRER